MTKNTAFLSVAALLASGLCLMSCDKTDNPDTIALPTRLTATLNGASEKPASTTSPATGTFVGDLNKSTRVLSYTVTYQGFPTTDPPTAGHLHRTALANGTGPVDIPFSNLTSPIIGTTAALPQSKVDSILNGFYYANIHTKTFPGGAIRGDIKK